jgi:hypothetical protein
LKVALDSKATSHLRNQLIAPLDLSTESCAGLLQRHDQLVQGVT